MQLEFIKVSKETPLPNFVDGTILLIDLGKGNIQHVMYHAPEKQFSTMANAYTIKQVKAWCLVNTNINDVVKKDKNTPLSKKELEKQAKAEALILQIATGINETMQFKEAAIKELNQRDNAVAKQQANLEKLNPLYNAALYKLIEEACYAWNFFGEESDREDEYLNLKTILQHVKAYVEED